jgi:hypothetical protein
MSAPSPERRNSEDIARAQSTLERSGGALKLGDSEIVGQTSLGLLWDKGDPTLTLRGPAYVALKPINSLQQQELTT